MHYRSEGTGQSQGGTIMVTGDAVRRELAPSLRNEIGTALNVQELVEEFLTEELGFAPGEVVATARFADDFGVDSMDLLELAVDAQERFGVEISDEALAKVMTVGDFDRCVSEAIARREPSSA